MNFIIMFMASPEYVRNPYLRAKMVEVLNCWMPRSRCFSSHERKLYICQFVLLMQQVLQ